MQSRRGAAASGAPISIRSDAPPSPRRRPLHGLHIQARENGPSLKAAPSLLARRRSPLRRSRGGCSLACAGAASRVVLTSTRLIGLRGKPASSRAHIRAVAYPPRTARARPGRAQRGAETRWAPACREGWAGRRRAANAFATRTRLCGGRRPPLATRAAVWAAASPAGGCMPAHAHRVSWPLCDGSRCEQTQARTDRGLPSVWPPSLPLAVYKT